MLNLSHPITGLRSAFRRPLLSQILRVLRSYTRRLSNSALPSVVTVRVSNRPNALEFMEIVERVKFEMQQSTSQRYIDY